VTGITPHRGVVVGAARGSTDLVARVLSLAGSLRRGISTLVLTSAAAAIVIAYALLRHGFPGQTGRAVVTILALALVATPPLVLGAFWFVLGELLELPERIRRTPLETREHAEQVRRIVREARSRRGWSTLPWQIWRLARLAASSRDLLTPYAPVLPLLSPPFVAGVVLSAAAVVAETAVALVLVLVLALT
jgi:ABC-type molybdate transport system permease subunit